MCFFCSSLWFSILFQRRANAGGAYFLLMRIFARFIVSLLRFGGNGPRFALFHAARAKQAVFLLFPFHAVSSLKL
jgi:hypothetical protein